MTYATPQLAPVLLERLAPWLTPQTDPYGDHAKYLTAIAAMGQELYGLVTDFGDDPDDPSWVSGWSVLFDVDLCPYRYLAFLAQLVGVQIPTGTSDADARTIIRSEQGQSRGTATSIVAAAKRNLTGTQSCSLLERMYSDGTSMPYWFVLVVRPEEVVSVAALTTAVDAVKPAGLMWSLIQTDTWTISQMEVAYASITSLEATFPTISALEVDVP